MRTLIRLFLILCITLFISLGHSFAAINFGITPIKYELNLAPGESITLPMSIRNNSATGVTLPTTTSDFTSNGIGGAPSFIRKSELVYPDQQLSTWITIDDSSVTAAPGELVSTNFTIDVPTTATPGGHYGAVFFKKQSGEVSASGNIGIDVDYGIIILVTVAGDIIVDAEISDPIISNGGGNYHWSGDQGLFKDGLFSYIPNNNSWYVGDDNKGKAIYQNIDSCPLGDFTLSKYDGKCFWKPLVNNDIESWDDNIKTPSIEDNFNIGFTFPIKNTGNTHIKPTGKIVLRDENGNIIKAIGKESISNDLGVILGEKIVDYIPINDQGGNILPSSQRVFQSEWNGFPHQEYDENGNKVMYYWSPSEYYTQKNKDDAGFLMLWQRVSESRKHKIITAEIELTYYDEQGNPIEFSTAKEFSIQYIEQEITTNPYVILALLLLGSVGIFLYFGVRWWFIAIRISKCWNCKKKNKSHWETCPHCSAIQDKKKHKAYQQQKEKETIKKKTVKKTPTKKTTNKKTVNKKKTSTKK